MVRFDQKTGVLLFLLFFTTAQLLGQNKKLSKKVEQTMLKATRFMVEKVSTNGGYLWHYLPDFSRRWGEMEAYPTMIWLQNPGTISMGNLFIDAYQATGNEYFYGAAQKAANAIIWGQSHLGGWNYMVDFAGDRSLKHWYNTIGKNGWRLEEFQQYYGNSTFDDDVTSEAARFLLRIYLEKLDPKYKPPLDKAIEFILMSQYPLGGWPQRYPPMDGFRKNGLPDYTAYYTFNDDVIWENVNFLIQCYQTLGEARYLDPIHRGMEFYILSQDSCGGWAQQLDLDLKIAGARSYEPAALLPRQTFENAMLLLRFYQITGDEKYLKPIPKAIEWLEKTAYKSDTTTERRYTHPTFINPATQHPVYVHRKGSNVQCGFYYCDENEGELLSHYYGKSYVPIDLLQNEYERVSNLSLEEVIKNSPLKIDRFEGYKTPQQEFDFGMGRLFERPGRRGTDVEEIIRSLDKDGRWLVSNCSTSHPYSEEIIEDPESHQYSSINVGDQTDTSPYRDQSDQLYISTSAYIRNMRQLINFIRKNR